MKNYIRSISSNSQKSVQIEVDEKPFVFCQKKGCYWGKKMTKKVEKYSRKKTRKESLRKKRKKYLKKSSKKYRKKFYGK